jgi:hypothetical protein
LSKSFKVERQFAWYKFLGSHFLSWYILFLHFTLA